MTGHPPALIMGARYTIKWDRGGHIKVYRGAVYIGRLTARDGILTVSGPAFQHPDGQLVVSSWSNIEIERESDAPRIIVKE